MQKIVRCSLLLVAAAVAQQAAASGVVHVANGDCAGLAAAANAAPGTEPALIVLARGGTYDFCKIEVKGTIAIDGAGATWVPSQTSSASIPSDTAIQVDAGAALTLRNTQIGVAASTPAGPAVKAPAAPKFCCIIEEPWISNAGTLTLDADSISGADLGGGPLVIAPTLLANSGSLIVRNTSFVGNVQNGEGLISNHGDIDLSHSTLVTAPGYSASALIEATAGTVAIANSILFNNGSGYPGPACNITGGTVVSRGGNVFGDASCGLQGANDRVAADLHALDFGLHGGVVGTLALDTTSPALNAGLAANCAATDARGLSRSTQTCDAGALEVGAGNGRLAASGMSGLYYNAANNGHYVTVQRLYGDQALVIWNTFDLHGTPAWLYGVGTVSNGTIHVAQVAQNVGGTLHPGGGVSGATPTLWGSFDFNIGDCFSASLSYTSPNAAFGSGTTALQRLAFVDGLDCQR